MFGKMVRQLRRDKGITLEALSDGILSTSQLSRFERDESEVTISIFHQLLQRLGLDYDELMAFSSETSLTKRQQFFRKMDQLYHHHKLEALIALREEIEEAKEVDAYFLTMYRCVLASLEPSLGPSKDTVEALSDYLFGLDYWGQYEITLLGNCVDQLGYDTVFLLTKELLAKKATYQSLDRNRRLAIQLSLNVMRRSTDMGRFDEATYLSGKIAQLLCYEDEFYEKIIYRYEESYLLYQLKKGDKQGMTEALAVLQILSPKSLYPVYLAHFNEIITKKQLL